MSQNLGQQYDAVPFPSLPIAQSQPAFLASIATLRGMQPADPAHARVLELGCAAGQNLLPLAERYPEARFLGIDLSTTQIAAGKQLAHQWGFANIELMHQDLIDFDLSLGPFDYIIAHGVYSWVEEPAREKLLRICRDALAAQGVAYVSYKTYPGWQLHDMMRHMMLYDSRHAVSPADRMQRARLVLDFLSQSCSSENSYDRLVRVEAQALSELPDPYLWHDHLAPESHPVLYEQFLRAATSHGLQPLGDATLGIRPTDSLDADLEQRLAALTTDPVKCEQIRDMARNRTVRQALLCPATTTLNPTMSSESLSGLRLSGALRCESASLDLDSDNVVQFQTASGARVGTALPLAKAALQHLGEIWPASIATEDLVAAAAGRVAQSDKPLPTTPEDIQRLRDNLLHCCLGQVIQVQFGPDSFVTHPGEQPLAGVLSRWVAPHSDVIPNRRHESVRLDSFDRHLLCLLDGQSNRPQLLERLVQAAADGQMVVMDAEKHQQSGDAARKSIEEAVPAALDRLASAALLIA